MSAHTIMCVCMLSGELSWLVVITIDYVLVALNKFVLRCRWERYQIEEEATLGRGKRQRKAVSYREAYAPHPAETPSEVIKKVISRVIKKVICLENLLDY